MTADFILCWFHSFPVSFIRKKQIEMKHTKKKRTCLINDQSVPGEGTKGQEELHKGDLDVLNHASQAVLDISVEIMSRTSNWVLNLYLAPCQRLNYVNKH